MVGWLWRVGGWSNKCQFVSFHTLSYHLPGVYVVKTTPLLHIKDSYHLRTPLCLRVLYQQRVSNKVKSMDSFPRPVPKADPVDGVSYCMTAQWGLIMREDTSSNPPTPTQFANHFGFPPLEKLSFYSLGGGSGGWARSRRIAREGDVGWWRWWGPVCSANGPELHASLPYCFCLAAPSQTKYTRRMAVWRIAAHTAYAQVDRRRIIHCSTLY